MPKFVILIRTAENPEVPISTAVCKPVFVRMREYVQAVFFAYTPNCFPEFSVDKSVSA